MGRPGTGPLKLPGTGQLLDSSPMPERAPVAEALPVSAERPGEQPSVQGPTVASVPVVPPPADSAGQRVGDRRVVTVLFADVSGFTSMSERLDPEEVREVVNDFFKVLTEPIYRYGGNVDKYIGDAIMAIFGAPVVHEDDAERAVMAALDMQAAARSFAEGVAARVGTQLKVRIGINTGLVVAGAVGGQSRQDYTVIGDTVNLAQRMEAAAPPGGVLVSESSYKLTRHHIRYGDPEPLAVKGRKSDLVTYVALGLNVAEDKPVEDWPLVGRDSEFGELCAVLDKTVRRGSQSVNLVGAPGSGKTHASRELRRWFAETHGGLVLHLVLPSYSEGISAWVIQELGRLIPERAREEQMAVPEGDAVASLMALAAERPMLLDLEDAHWMDPDSLAWLRSLLSRVEDHPDSRLCIMLQFRSSSDKDFAEDIGPPRTTISLESMDEFSMMDLLEALEQPMDLSGLSEEDRLALVRVADGSPGFLIELVKSRKGITDSSAKGEAGAVPLVVSAQIASRLDGLPQVQRQLLQVASVVGLQFRRGLVDAVAGLRDTHGAWAELLLQDLISGEDDDVMQFTNNWVQAVTYDSMLLSARRDLHLRIAQTLEPQLREGERNGVDPLRVAEHFIKAEQPAKGVAYLVRAAEAALDDARLTEARQLLDQAQDALMATPPGPSPAASRVQVCQGRLALSEEDPARARRHFHRALLAAPLGEAGAHALAHLADVLESLGDRRGAEERLLEALALLHETDSQRAVHLSRLSLLRLTLGEVDAAFENAEEALRGLPVLPSIERWQALSVKGRVLYRRGQLIEAEAIQQQAVDLAEGLADDVAVATSLLDIGRLQMRGGSWRLAEATLKDAIERAQDARHRSVLAGACGRLGVLRLVCGEFEAAAPLFLEAAHIYKVMGDERRVALNHLHLAELAHRQGHGDAALRGAEEALKVIEAKRSEGLSEAWRLLAEIHLAADRVDAAREAVAKAEAEVVDPGLQGGAVLRVQAALAVRSGSAELAMTLLDEALALLEAPWAQPERIRVLELRATLLRRLGRDVDAAASAAQVQKLRDAMRLDVGPGAPVVG
ncbi:MAG: adenylate/guanylate cyclase domain-containing protein [Candidatus Sericytochromatia bacterium]|nr:adenylate/guanylate cyclase domain-containing protein [Candidatus Sericytochromatia bacterium]